MFDMEALRHGSKPLPPRKRIIEQATIFHKPHNLPLQKLYLFLNFLFRMAKEFAASLEKSRTFTEICNESNRDTNYDTKKRIE